MKTESLVFILVTLALVLLGLLCMFSASYEEALSFGFDSSYFLKRQIVFAVAAIVASFVIALIPMRFFRFSVIPLMAICLILMLLTLFTNFGVSTLGARRWLSLGPLPSFQPSEIVKFSTILFLASVLSIEDSHSKMVRQLICAGVCLCFATLILLQKDYSTTVVYLGVCIAMLLLSHVNLPWVLIGFGFLMVGGTAVMLSEPYRVKRIAAFLFPNLDPSGINYQVTIARKAISSGGLWGKGLGNGYYKKGILPEVQNDFILANIAEELGFAGVLLIFLLFIAFAVIGWRGSRRIWERDRFSGYAAFGFTTMIFWQSLVNAAVVSGLFPPTGIPMPFFSQGGTNLFVVIIEAGFLARIVRDSLSSRKAEVTLFAATDDLVFPEKP